MQDYVSTLSDAQRKRLAADSRKALRQAWPHRHTSPLRARIVIGANVRMLRRLRDAV